MDNFVAVNDNDKISAQLKVIQDDLKEIKTMLITAINQSEGENITATNCDHEFKPIPSDSSAINFKQCTKCGQVKGSV